MDITRYIKFTFRYSCYTIELLDMIGIDSIKLIKIDYNKYEMQFLKTGRFEIFEKLYKRT